MNGPTNHLCPHEQNPNNCLICFRLPKPGAQPAPARTGPDVEANSLGAPFLPLPGRGPALVMGDRAGSNVGVPGSGHPEVDEAAKERYRYPKGRPVQQGEPPPQPQPRTTQGGGSYDADGHWVASAHGSVIDALPSHPKAPPPRG